MKTRWIAIIAALVVLALACNVPGQVAGPTTQPQGEAVQVQPGEESQTTQLQGEDQTITQEEGQPPAQEEDQAAPTEAPLPTEEPTPTPVPSEPVSIREGLSSLNSYILKLTFKFSGPSEKDLTDMQTEIQFSRDADSSLSHIHSLVSTAENPETSASDSYVYRVGNEECSGSKEDWTFNTMNPAQKEMKDIFEQMLDITPMIGDPELVGQENVNGVETNHFTFEVKGLGATSGAEVTANQGDYWLAIDGRYIVRYTLVMETRSGPTTDIMHEEIRIELTNINQPLQAVAFPQGCIAAKNKPKE
jgi:hypothetical protein